MERGSVVKILEGEYEGQIAKVVAVETRLKANPVRLEIEYVDLEILKSGDEISLTPSQVRQYEGIKITM